MLAFFKKVAPWLAAGAEFIPGAGPIISAGLTDIAKSNSITLPSGGIKPTIDSISEAVVSIAGHPEGLAALKAQDQTYALQMQAANFKEISDIEALGNADRANARNREIQVKDNTPRNLAYAYAIGFFVTLGAEIWMAMSGHPINPLAEKSVDILLGVLTGMVLGTKEYYFGTSAGEQTGNKALADIAKS